MTLLNKYVYGTETDPKKTPFGLINNQIKIDSIIQCAGWFNIKGEKLGSGDLTLKDMDCIAKNIPSSEVFFVLTEVNSNWDMPSHLNASSPGFNYVVEKSTWVITKSPSKSHGLIIRVRDDLDKQEDSLKDGIKYSRFPRKDLYKAFGYVPSEKLQPIEIQKPTAVYPEPKIIIPSTKTKSKITATKKVSGFYPYTKSTKSKPP